MRKFNITVGNNEKIFFTELEIFVGCNTRKLHQIRLWYFDFECQVDHSFCSFRCWRIWALWIRQLSLNNVEVIFWCCVGKEMFQWYIGRVVEAVCSAELWHWWKWGKIYDKENFEERSDRSEERLPIELCYQVQ